ncbi:GAF and HD-GYP domain-containing protein [Halomonas sp. LS-001]
MCALNNPNSDTDIQRIRKLNEIGIALSAENNHAALLEHILTSARELTQADAGTLYVIDNECQQLAFTIVQNDTLGVHLGGLSEPVGPEFPRIPLYRSDGQPNQQLVVACSVLNDCTVNIEDAYTAVGFDFSGTRNFDKQTGYRSRAFLTVPMHNHEGDIVAVLQLLNKRTANGIDGTFNSADQHIAESLASQAAVAMTNRRLIEEMQALFDSFIRVIAKAIDTKSAHTGAHCRRVPEATLLLAEAAHRSQHPGVASFTLSDDDRYELKTAAWLHDCGKIVTPHHVVEKSTKLEGLFDRIATIEVRFAAQHQALTNTYLRTLLDAHHQGHSPPADAEQSYQQLCQQLNDDLAFIRKANTGGEFMQDDDITRLQQIAAQQWEDIDGLKHPMLTADELENLSIRRGTLNPAERRIIEDHMVATLDMLAELPFPKHLKRVPEYAGGHHEHMDGKGYPKGLTREQLSLPARMMGIADVFEALTAPDRPYKPPMKLSQALNIMGRMVEEQHLDQDLFTVFVTENVYLDYAQKHLANDQIDTVDLTTLPGLNVMPPQEHHPPVNH